MTVLYMIRLKKKENGFTLIEVLLALTIILIGIVSVFRVEVYVADAENIANSKFKATFLAQEGIEVVKSIRDANWLDEQSWDTGLGATGNSNVEYNSLALNDVADNLYLDGSNIYTHNAVGTTPTIFSRHIEIAYLLDGDGITYMQVKSVVDFVLKGQVRTVVAEEHLYDWR